MWLLSTDRAELHYFPSPEEVPDGYGALSHVWDDTEQSFQDVQKIQKWCTKNGANPRDAVCEKIRRCCELAERHGYKWVWIDTCCIDKTSSTELSEAINSMFRYYSLARICYGYMRDVTLPPERTGSGACLSDMARRTWCQSFRGSIWFRRGWTLQELIAPRFFLFISRCWRVIASKADFAVIVELVTKIPVTVLRLKVSHTTYSISQRMSWFGSRKTTRLEDEAYCLLGLFDVHMPPLYGEGRNAFQRLQEEIMKQSPDTTLFAWNIQSDGDDDAVDRSCLLAPSPSVFETNHLAYIPLQDMVTRYKARAVPGARDMSFSITPHGILAYIPIITCKGDTYTDLFWCSEVDSRHLRVLLCLNLDEDTIGDLAPSRRTVYVVSHVGPPSRLRWMPVDPPNKSLKYVIDGHKARASWQTVLIRHRPPPHRLPGQPSGTRAPYIPPTPTQLLLDAPFRFHESHIQKFMHHSRAKTVAIQEPSFTSFRRRTAYVFGWSQSTIVIRVGTCRKSVQTPSDSNLHLSLDRNVWARVIVSTSPERYPRYKVGRRGDGDRHDCLEDHVSSWPDSRKRFELGAQFHEKDAAVSLTFAPCPINPRGTLVLDATYHCVSRPSTGNQSVRVGGVDV